jgi:cytochrome c-type biogenesis protein CcmH
MADAPPPKRGISSATVALGAAAILAVAAVGIAIFRPDDRTEPTIGNSTAPPGQAPSIDDAIATLQQEVRRDPDDHEKWFLLAMAQREVGRFAEAEHAFRRAMQLDPQDPKYHTYLGEAMLLQGGRDPPAETREEAERLFRRALELQPGNAAARFYLATLKDLRGDHRTAVNELLQLLREAPADAPWEGQVREAVTAIAARRQIDISGRLPPPRQPAAPTGTATAAIPGPTREQMEAARAIPPGEQDAMVRAMVDRLANRLRQNPRDADGWIRLMRSRMVLGDSNAAREALHSGLAAFPDDATTQQRLRTAASELGVPAG